VRAVTLLDILDTVSATSVILKIDIEGYECRVRHHSA
jgi:hypothetical protein